MDTVHGSWGTANHLLFTAEKVANHGPGRRTVDGHQTAESAHDMVKRCRRDGTISNDHVDHGQAVAGERLLRAKQPRTTEPQGGAHAPQLHAFARRTYAYDQRESASTTHTHTQTQTTSCTCLVGRSKVHVTNTAGGVQQCAHTAGVHRTAALSQNALSQVEDAGDVICTDTRKAGPWPASDTSASMQGLSQWCHGRATRIPAGLAPESCNQRSSTWTTAGPNGSMDAPSSTSFDREVSMTL
jgi:hypothetical protein